MPEEKIEVENVNSPGRTERVNRAKYEALPRLLCAPDRAAAGRAQAAMMQMGKIDIAALQVAFNAS